MKVKECQSLFLHHNSQIIRFFEHNVDHKKGRVIRHTIPKIGISVSSDDKKDKTHFDNGREKTSRSSFNWRCSKSPY